MDLKTYAITERNIIAEFVFSIKNDILIKNDVMNLIRLLEAKNEITFDEFNNYKKRIYDTCDSVAFDIYALLREKVGIDKIKLLMTDYVTGSRKIDEMD